jgi:hypothetical protein
VRAVAATASFFRTTALRRMEALRLPSVRRNAQFVGEAL